MPDTKEKAVNYTPEMVETAIQMYVELGNDGLDAIAERLGKNVRSVRSKLVREGVYVAPVKGASTAKNDGPTKKELLAELRGVTPFDFGDGLNGATKDAIKDLLVFFDAQAVENFEDDQDADADAEAETASESEAETA